MTAPDHTLEPFKNHLHQRGHPYMFQINGFDKNAGMARCGEDPLKLARTESMHEKRESVLRVL